MSKPYSPSRPLRLSDVERWDIETDVAVIGFGISGACAAIEAKNAGAQVTIFEVAAASGGSAALSGGDIYLGGNGGTPAQKAAGFEDQTEDFVKYLMMAGGPGADEARVRLYAENAVAHYHWLVEQGLPFKNSYLPGKWLEPTTDDTLIWSGSEAAWPFAQQAKPAPRGHTPQMKGWGAGKLIMETLTAKAHSLGIESHFSSRALALIADQDNRVHGLVVRIDGEPRMVRARKGVILCSGGFICNEEMVKRYVPASRVCPNPTSGGNDDGSGIRMGMSVGGDVLNMDQFFATRPFYPPESLVKGIFVNELGQRFINEDAYHGRVTHYMLRQPNDRCWLLVDSTMFERPVTYPDITVAAVGETWEEVEQELGIPAGELVHTVERFNRHAEQGEDPLWHKDAEYLQPLIEAPFAALAYGGKDYIGTSFTLGGLSTLPNGQVLTPEGEAIPGLYAAGRCACGIPRWGEGYSSGMSLGDSSFFGRQAGRQAAGA
ncbi:FAD-dependent oxidoreductase [Denitratisoma oestradiolicum]|uniref:Fumarate reductase n=1 Tax=Denitratisoma oestradiolicum TaxID=311182 RepID=A0A6S6XSG9_9PROT|nr:FAD-dependent oxidoreductase [Denitratisoma oestradiolicum]TWO80578.1 flavoprotein [Denitratisoma oestradiolicum]CAB1367650.1 Fumarate reductase [Denitratisoma oestradiolicum]